MTGWAPITGKVDDRGFGESRFGNTINGIIGHIVAGYDGLAFVSGDNNRNNHPTYHIDRWGKVTGLVRPSRRPTTTAHSIDQEAVTVEMDNSGLGPRWEITDATLASYIELIKFHGSKSPRKGFAVNKPGVGQTEFFIGMHRQYHQVACPGDYVVSKMPYILKAVKGTVTAGPIKKTPVSPKPTPKPAPKRNTLVRAPGGEHNAPLWPKGPLMATIQQRLKARGRYTGIVDGIGGDLTAKGIQITLNWSQKNGAGRRFVKTAVDGRLGINNGYGVQYYGADFADYRGPIDGDPRMVSWTNFAQGLK